MKGFTLIELLIYTAIFAIIGGLMTGILLITTQVGQRESASTEVTGQLNFVIQTVQRLIQESSAIDINAGVTISTLKLRMKDPAKDPTCISLTNNIIKLAEGPGTNPNNCTTATSDLTSDRVIVNTLNFKKFTQYPGHDTVSIDLTMSYNTSNPKGQVQRTLSSAIARVSAATFDSDVLPGGTYNYSLGQAGSPWQKVIVADGTAGEPAYTFGSATNMGLFRVSGNTLGFTTAGTEAMRIDGQNQVYILNELAIGTTAAPLTQLDLNYLYTNINNGYGMMYIRPTKIANVNGTYNNLGFRFNPAIVINSGVTDSGYMIGGKIQSLRRSDNPDDSGTLASLYGLDIDLGNYGTSIKSTNNIYGINIDVYHGAGAIINSYGLRIYQASTGASVTNNYGIYVGGSDMKNYFAGDVGIGTTAPSYKLDVSGNFRVSATSTFSGNVGIGTTNPAYKLDVNGDIRATGNFIVGWERISNDCGSNSTCEASCTSGKYLLGGGCSSGGYNIRKSYPLNSNTWYCNSNDGGGAYNAYAICAKVQ